MKKFMKNSLYLIILCATSLGLWGQEDKVEKEKQEALKRSENLTYDGNKSLVQNDFVQAEATYRKAISKSSGNSAAPYNLGRAYYNRESFGESFGRFKEASEKAEEKPVKHKAYHNMGNVFMRTKEYQKAVEAYKQALRNNPTDEETRYNLALAKKMLEKEQNDPDNQKNDQDQNQEKKEEEKKNDQNNQGDKDKNEEGKDKDKEGDKDKEEDKDGDKGDGGDEEKKEEQEGEGEEKEEQKKQPNPGEDEERQQTPRPNSLSKQQIENLLEAMQNQEKKVQEKLDAKKVKGTKIKNEKDW